MRVLVTGAAGFIGSQLVDRLLADGHRVVELDRFAPFYEPDLKRFYLRDAFADDSFSLVEGDVRAAAWERVAETAGDAGAGAPFDAVVHLAALAGVRPSIEEPVRYQEVNIGGTQRVLEYSRRRGVGSFVFGSSSSVYGEREEVPFSEDDQVDHPISPYAATKPAGELLCHTHDNLFDVDVLCLRFFTVYSPCQRPDLAIHKFARLIARAEPITQHGDGSSRRDYTYIDDILQGVTGALGNLEEDDDVFEVVNLGESETKWLSRLIGDAMGVDPEIEVLPEQPGDVGQTYADVSKARRLLGYEPSVPIEEGIGRFVEWFRRHQGMLTEVPS